MEFLSRTQHSMTFHFIPFLLRSFPFDAPLVLRLSAWVLSPLPSTDTTQAAYLIPSLLSPLSPLPSAFSSIFDVEKLVFRLPSSRRLVSFRVLSSSNLVLLTFFMRLGRDWFSYCTITVPHAQILLSDDMCLTFSLSPLLAVRPRHTSEFLLS